MDKRIEIEVRMCDRSKTGSGLLMDETIKRMSVSHSHAFDGSGVVVMMPQHEGLFMTKGPRWTLENRIEILYGKGGRGAALICCLMLAEKNGVDITPTGWKQGLCANTGPAPQ